jgi:hypothetical protein
MARIMDGDGWTQDGSLSARDAVGHLGAAHITRSFIANIESRRRGLSVDDLLVLALALDVRPTELLTLADQRGSTPSANASAHRRHDACRSSGTMTRAVAARMYLVRLVSLLPSVTEIVYALGRLGQAQAPGLQMPRDTRAHQRVRATFHTGPM